MRDVTLLKLERLRLKSAEETAKLHLEHQQRCQKWGLWFRVFVVLAGFAALCVLEGAGNWLSVVVVVAMIGLKKAPVSSSEGPRTGGFDVPITQG